jgi:hypothetical protein
VKFTLVFMHNTASYCCHAQGCSAATDDPTRRGGRSAFPEAFESIAAAHAFADQDESEKAGESTKAIWRVCKCAKAAG